LAADEVTASPVWLAYRAGAVQKNGRCLGAKTGEPAAADRRCMQGKRRAMTDILITGPCRDAERKRSAAPAVASVR
jgi:hypothetical protein